MTLGLKKAQLYEVRIVIPTPFLVGYVAILGLHLKVIPD